MAAEAPTRIPIKTVKLKVTRLVPYLTPALVFKLIPRRCSFVCCVVKHFDGKITTVESPLER